MGSEPGEANHDQVQVRKEGRKEGALQLNNCAITVA